MWNLLKIFSRPQKNVPDQTPPPVPPAERGGRRQGGTYLTEFAFNIKWQIMEERMSTTNLILTIAFGGLFICFITLFYGYWQFSSTSYNDYSQKVKDLNDDRYEMLQNRIKYLEIQTETQSKTATQSGEQRTN